MERYRRRRWRLVQGQNSWRQTSRGCTGTATPQCRRRAPSRRSGCSLAGDEQQACLRAVVAPPAAVALTEAIVAVTVAIAERRAATEALGSNGGVVKAADLLNRARDGWQGRTVKLSIQAAGYLRAQTISDILVQN